MRDMRRIAIIFGVVLILGLVGGAFWMLARSPGTPEVVSGTIETDEVHVASRFGGRVTRTLAREGDTLIPGQVILELDAAELPARRDQAQAALDELVNGPRPEEIAAARHDWEALAADLVFTQVDTKRTVELFEQKAVSEGDKDRAVTRLDSAEKNVAASRSRYDLVLAGSRPERIAAARGQLEEIQTEIREMKVMAPTNCVLEVLEVKAGDVLAPNREVATLLLKEPLWVRVYVPEPWLGYIKVGQKVKVRVDSFPNQDFDGERNLLHAMCRRWRTGCARFSG